MVNEMNEFLLYVHTCHFVALPIFYFYEFEEKYATNHFRLF